MSDKIEKSYKDLNWEEVSFNKNEGSRNNCWYWSCGGYPLFNNEWSINYIDDNLVETRYKMPDCINEMLNLCYKHGREESKREIQTSLKRILGCNECENEKEEM